MLGADTLRVCNVPPLASTNEDTTLPLCELAVECLGATLAKA